MSRYTFTRCWKYQNSYPWESVKGTGPDLKITTLILPLRANSGRNWLNNHLNFKANSNATMFMALLCLFVTTVPAYIHSVLVSCINYPIREHKQYHVICVYQPTQLELKIVSVCKWSAYEELCSAGDIPRRQSSASYRDYIGVCNRGM